jgi:hypothetical protein
LWTDSLNINPSNQFLPPEFKTRQNIYGPEILEKPNVYSAYGLGQTVESIILGYSPFGLPLVAGWPLPMLLSPVRPNQRFNAVVISANIISQASMGVPSGIILLMLAAIV